MASRVTRAANKDRVPARPDTSHRHLDITGTDVEPTELTLADIQQSITRSFSTVCEKLDALTLEVASIKSKTSDLEDSVTMNSDKLIEIEQRKLPEIEKKMADEISQLKDKLTAMEIYGRRTNLLFYGVKESPNEHVENILRDTFSYLGIDADDAASIALVIVHRLPRRDNASSQASGGPTREPVPRAIIAKFVYMGDRDKVLAAFEGRQRQRQPQVSNAAQSQESRRITVRTDLPPALKARRSSLAKIAYELRKEKNVSTKLSVVGTKVLLKWKEKTSSTWNLYQD